MLKWWKRNVREWTGNPICPTPEDHVLRHVSPKGLSLRSGHVVCEKCHIKSSLSAVEMEQKGLLRKVEDDEETV